MGSKTVKTKEKATTTPNLNQNVAPLVDNYYTQLGPLMGGDASAFAPKTNPLLTKAQEGGRNLGSDFSSAYGYINSGAANAFNTPDATTTNVNGPAGPTAAQARLPGAPTLARVSNVADPVQQMATVGNYGPLAMAGDGTGYAGDGPMGFGGATGYQGIDNYMNPQLEGYIKAFYDDFDNEAGKQRAAYERSGALNKAMGGSGYYLGQGQLDADLTRDRALGGAQLGYDAWKTAADFSSRDADRANSAGIASMQSANDYNKSLADRLASLSMFNAGSVNDRSKSIFDATNENSRFNATEGNDLSALLYGERNANARQDASSANELSSLLFGQGAETNRFNTGQTNDMAGRVYGERSANARQDAAAANDTSQFNSRLGLDRAGMQMDAGRAIADIGANEAASRRADIGVQQDLGTQLMEIQQRQDLSPYTKQQIIAELINGAGILGATTGQTINSEGTSKQSGGLLQSLLGAGAQLGSAAIMASERRVKRDIMLLGREGDGLGVYRYNYVWDDADELPRFGVMVDEVASLRPWALGPIVDGIQTVDYGAL